MHTAQDQLVCVTAGTNVDEARRLLQESGLPITPADHLTDAADKAVTSLLSTS